MADTSYTPLRMEFEGVLAKYFNGPLTTGQRDTLQKMFFAGASVSVKLIRENPGCFETVQNELADFVDQSDRAKVV